MTVEDLAFDPDFENTPKLEYNVQPRARSAQKAMPKIALEQHNRPIEPTNPVRYQQRSNQTFEQQSRLDYERQYGETHQKRAQSAPRKPSDILLNKTAENRRQRKQEELVSVLDRPQTYEDRLRMVEERAQKLYEKRASRPKLEPEQKLELEFEPELEPEIERVKESRQVVERRIDDADANAIVKALKLLQPYTKRLNEPPQGGEGRLIDSRLPPNRSPVFARMPKTQFRVEAAKGPAKSIVSKPAVELDDDEFDMIDEDAFEREFSTTDQAPISIAAGPASTESKVSLGTIGAALSKNNTAESVLETARHQALVSQKAPAPAYANINDAFDRDNRKLQIATQQQADLFENLSSPRIGYSLSSRSEAGRESLANPFGLSNDSDDELQQSTQPYGNNGINSDAAKLANPINVSFGDNKRPAVGKTRLGHFPINYRQDQKSTHRNPTTMLQPVETNFSDQTDEESEQRDPSFGERAQRRSLEELQMKEDLAARQLEQEQTETTRRKVQIQRAEYRTDLRSPMARNPAHMTLSYVDDAGDSVPPTEDQQLYLLNFAGFHYLPYEGGTVRRNSFGSDYNAKTAMWASPNYCFQPLYFEDVNLERFGARHPFLQPALSALHFFGSTIRLPYQVVQSPYHECTFTAGYGRPGNRYCYQRERLPSNQKALSFQALLTTGIFFAL